MRSLKLNFLIPLYGHKTALAFITLVSLITINAACGKRRPPLPPVERVAQRVEISGLQQGNAVIISWTMPARNAPEGSILNIDRIDVYRLIEPADAPLSLSEEEFSSRGTLIATLPVSEDDFGLKKKSYSDTLEFTNQNARIRYAIRFVNSAGQKAAFSNFLLIEPAARIAENPENLRGRVTQDEILLEWEKPAANVDGTMPANLLGYNIYRSSQTDETPRRLNKTPVNETSFSDRFFEFGKTYNYFVRSVSLGAGGEPIESSDSNILNVTPVDTFPPNPPEAITVAAAPNVISIFFAANIEKDVVGYRIYRSLDPDIPKENWELLTPELLTTNTFADSNVEPGKTYYYYLTAVDKFGNISEPSEVVSETAL